LHTSFILDQVSVAGRMYEVDADQMTNLFSVGGTLTVKIDPVLEYKWFLE